MWRYEFGETLTMMNDTLIHLVALGCAACSVAALSWLGMRHMVGMFERAARERASARLGVEMPCEQATMPMLWRMCWPAIMRLAQVLRWAMRSRPRGPRHVALDRAGLAPGIDDTHIFAARLLAAFTLLILALIFAQAVGITVSGASAGASAVQGLLVGASVTGLWLPGVWLQRRARWRMQRIERALPFLLDLLALCVQGGLSLQGAMLECVRFGPRGVLRDELASVLAELRSGQSRAQAFEGLARRSGSRAVRASVSAILQAEALGISLGSQLKEQAQAQSTARFDQAERKALKAPVKLLLPLMLFIFPCTFVVIGFPIFISMRQALT